MRWIEYSFKQIKNELGWADFRLTDYQSIERWWELVFSAYLMISLHAQAFKDEAARNTQLSSKLSAPAGNSVNTLAGS